VDPATPEKRAHHPTQFSAHVYCGQMAGWMKTPVGTEVDRGPRHIVLECLTVNFLVHQRRLTYWENVFPGNILLKILTKISLDNIGAV